MLDIYLDEYKPRNNVLHSWGGNVNPACAPVKGHWNHIAHKLSLHFQATDIEVLRCGNVPGIPPGSTSPVTPFNFIEFRGPAGEGRPGQQGLTRSCATSRVRGPQRAREQRGQGGVASDRYFLNVFDCATHQTLLLVDTDVDPVTVDPITITGGNMQMHFNPCDN